MFPKDIARKKIAFYKTKQEVYGLPLDSRAKYTKLDWLLWTATLSENRADFDALFGLAYKFASQTPDRVPLTDFCDTDTGKPRYFSGSFGSWRGVHSNAHRPGNVEEVGGASARGFSTVAENALRTTKAS